ncbi:hypothetical protein T484DRAFT_1956101 [Baffinella frigidus]|nr:hypothetical protein T484DRAFT_1956101 [Cryptophyta sp. CCMP2293]
MYCVQQVREERHQPDHQLRGRRVEQGNVIKPSSLLNCTARHPPTERHPPTGCPPLPPESVPRLPSPPHRVPTDLPRSPQFAPVTSKVSPWVSPLVKKTKPYAPAAAVTVVALATPPVLTFCAIVAFFTAPVTHLILHPPSSFCLFHKLFAPDPFLEFLRMRERKQPRCGARSPPLTLTTPQDCAPPQPGRGVFECLWSLVTANAFLCATFSHLPQTRFCDRRSGCSSASSRRSSGSRP